MQVFEPVKNHPDYEINRLSQIRKTHNKKILR